MPLAYLQGAVDPFFIVDVEHDAAEPDGRALCVGHNGAERAYPVAGVRMSVHPVLDIEIAAGLRAFLDRLRRAIPVLQVEQGKEQVESTG